MRLAGTAAVAAGVAVVAVTVFAPPQTATLAPAPKDASSGAAVGVTAECQVAPVVGLDADQTRNAKAIVDAAKRANVGTEGAVVAVSAALVEGVYTRGEKSTSKVVGLRNVPYGHGSSKGIFQELAGSGSGFTLTDAQRMDVGAAAARFYAKLGRVNGWRSMQPGDAAQAVQRSAFPARYGQRAPQARAIVAAVGGGKSGECAPVAGMPGAPGQTCKPTRFRGVEAGLSAPALRGLRCGMQAAPWVKSVGGRGPRQNKSDHGSGYAVDFMVDDWDTKAGNARGWQLAKWFQKHHAALNVKYVIFDDKIWSPSQDRAGWRPYTHPLGPTTNKTLRHLDHPHVSFNR